MSGTLGDSSDQVQHAQHDSMHATDTAHAPAEGTLEHVAAHVTRASVSQRHASLSSLEAIIQADGASLQPDDIAQIVDILFSTLFIYDDRDSMVHLEKVWTILFARQKDNVALIKSFVAKFKKWVYTLVKTPDANVAVRVTLMRWSCIAVEASFATLVASGPAFSFFIGLQSTLLDSFLEVHPHTRDRVFNRVVDMLARNAMHERYLAYLVEQSEPTAANAALLHALLLLYTREERKSLVAPLFEKNKALFLDWYLKVIWGSPSAVGRVHPSFQPLIHVLTGQDMEATILPPVSRAIKRYPEVVLQALRYLIDNTTADLSPLARGTLLPLITPIIIGPNDALRKDAAAAAVSLAGKCRDPSVHPGLVEDIWKLTQPPLPTPSQRQGVVSTLAAYPARIPFLDDETRTKTAAYIVPLLTSFAEKEPNDDAKIAGLGALGAWLGFAPVAIPAPAIKVYQAELKRDKEPLRAAAIDSIDAAVASFKQSGEASPSSSSSSGAPLLGDAAKAAQCGVFIDTLGAMLKKQANPKQAELNAPVAAVRLLARLASLDASLAPAAEKAGLSGSAASAQSVVSNPAFVLRMTEEAQGMRAIAQCETLLLGLHAKLAAATRGAEEPSDRIVAGSAVHLMAHHPSWTTRRAARAMVTRVLKQVPTLSDAFVCAFHNMTKALSVATSIASSSSSSSSSPSTPQASVLSAALFTCVSPAMTPALFPLLTLLFHHPLLTENNVPFTSVLATLEHLTSTSSSPIAVHVSTQWKTATRILGGPAALLHDRAEDLAHFLVGEQALLVSPQDGGALYSAAAQNALSALVSVSPTSILAVVTPLLLEMTRPAIFEDISEEDLAIYHTPEGQLYKVLVAGKDEYKPAAAQDKNMKRDKAARMYKAADEEWEKQLRRELEAKKKKDLDGGSKKLGAEEQAQLERETIVRRQVTGLVHKAQRALHTLIVLAASRPRALHEVMHTIVPVVLPLLKQPLVADTTYTLLQALGFCLDVRFASSGLVRLVPLLLGEFYSPGPTLSDAALSSALTHTVARAKEGALQGPIPAPSFTLIFPLLKVALERVFTLSAQEISMELVERHVTPGPPYPRDSMIGVLVHVLSNSQRLEPRARGALLAISAGCGLHDFNQLLIGLQSPNAQVRAACLQGLDRVPALRGSALPQSNPTTTGLWLALFDTDQANVAAAERLWKVYGHPLPRDYLEMFLPILDNPDKEVRKMGAYSISGAVGGRPGPPPAEGTPAAPVRGFPDTLTQTMSSLFTRYSECVPDTRDPRDDQPYLIHTRCGVAASLGAMASAFGQAELVTVFGWLLSTGLVDPRDEVTSAMVEAGIDIINDRGKEHHATMLPIFENLLNRPDSGSRTQDKVRESVVIFLGALAKHLDPSGPRVMAIVERLLDALGTPSQLVQQTVSRCLAQAMPAIRDQADVVVKRLLQHLKVVRDYGERRGCAYGIAGVVKGLGISSLKQYDIMSTLTSYVDDKKHPHARQGALFAFECLSHTIGRLFEPYAIHILPKLLACFGDKTEDIREATGDAARAIMGQLSGHGVKLVLPALLKAIEDRSWRSKMGSIELLGAMAFCAPRQLSSCLPQIVPRLTHVLTDTQVELVQSAREALSHIGSVIRNPEVQALVPKLLKALDDPDAYAREVLEALMHTNFMHTIDSASLSLIMPIVDRGLKERQTELKKRSAQILGNMCSLTEHKELIPYVDKLLPSLKGVVIDPIPEVRTVAAKALGLLVQGLGEEQFPKLLNWLLETMRGDLGSVERSGAAQALGEVLAAMEPARMQATIPDLIKNINSKSSNVREGVMNLFMFLPHSLGSRFEPFLPKILPGVLAGLADDFEVVREVSMRAGHVIVIMYALTSPHVLLPSLEDGLFHDNWRIRQNSVQLLGDLFEKVTGGQKDDEEEESRSARAQSRVDISQILGKERVNSILAALYMIRFDVSTVVRQKGMVVWKSVVHNTPRTLREILPSLMTTLIAGMGSSNLDKRQVAGRTLGDLVGKLGERVLPEIIPILEAGLDSPQSEKRQGVCLGLSEVIAGTGKQQLEAYMREVIDAVRKALCDPLEEVREAAAQAFDMLFNNVGNRAVDEILPPLLQSLANHEGNPNAMDALRQILLVRSNVVLPFLIPKLMTRPVTAANATAISSVASVAGSAMTPYLEGLLPLLLEAGSDKNNADRNAIMEAAETLVLAIQEDGLHNLLPELVNIAKESNNAGMRAGAARLLGAFSGNTRVSFDAYVHMLIGVLVRLFNDPVTEVQSQAWDALGNVTKTIKKENMAFVLSMQEAINNVSGDIRGELLPGFNLPKGLGPVLPVLLNGLVYGTPDVREQAASTLGMAITLTGTEALEPFVVQITGSLIRAVADRFSWQVKAAILNTLTLLINKGGLAVKRFLPQLQTTFIKALHDSSREVRHSAATALGKLMSLQARVDPLLNELVSGVVAAQQEGSGVQDAILRALHGVLEKAGSSADAAVMSKVCTTLVDMMETSDEYIRRSVARVVGVFASFATDDQLSTILAEAPSAASYMQRHGRALALSTVMRQRPAIMQGKFRRLIVDHIMKDMRDDKAEVREAAAQAVGTAVIISPDLATELLAPLSTLVSDSASGVAVAALRAVKRVAKSHPALVQKLNAQLVPPVMGRLKDRMNLPIKLASERALMHMLQIHGDPEVLTEFTQTTDPNTAKTLLDYVKRVISKLPEESEDEEEQDTAETQPSSSSSSSLSS